jgi:TonB family protein
VSRLPRGAILAGATALFLFALAVLMIVAQPRRRGVARTAVAEAPATVTAEVAELKREGTARAEVVEKLERGARVTIVSDRGRWLEVRTEKRQSGFLLEETVETDADRASRQKRASKVFSFRAMSGVVAEDSDVLLAPFPLAAHAGRLRKGDTIPIHAVDHDYYAFRRDGGLAFVRSSDVDLVAPDPRGPAIIPEKGNAPKDVKVSDLALVPTPEPSGETSEPGVEPLVRAAAEEEPAVLASKVDPQYPEAARRAEIEGTVVLEATIDEKGSVTDVQVLRGLPLGVSEAAIEAVSRWKYRAARGKNGPVVSHKTIRVIFRLGP